MSATDEAGRVIISAQVDADVRDELLRRATKAQRTLSGEVRLALLEHIRRANAVTIHQPPRAAA